MQFGICGSAGTEGTEKKMDGREIGSHLSLENKRFQQELTTSKP